MQGRNICVHTYGTVWEAIKSNPSQSADAFFVCEIKNILQGL